jgi:aspartate aminotransferase-like enzyme
MPSWKRKARRPLDEDVDFESVETTPLDGDPDFVTVQAAVQPLWTAYFEEPDRLTPVQSALVHIWATLGMVDNGGLVHFFDTIGDRGTAVVTGFRALGLTEYADIIERTLRLYPAAAVGDPDERLRAQAAWEEGGTEETELGALDDQAIRISHSRQVERAAAAFVRAHPDDFPEALGH